jgi:hypothetical protein
LSGSPIHTKTSIKIVQNITTHLFYRALLQVLYTDEDLIRICNLIFEHELNISSATERPHLLECYCKIYIFKYIYLNTNIDDLNID